MDPVIPPQRLPTSFRIFTAGKVDTSKGNYLFDAKAAASVMSRAKAYGNAYSIDYEHKSIDPDARAGDGIAAGFCGLALRGGELWAVNCRWTERAARGLSAGEWKYMSPTFASDPKTGRITELFNIALTNIPATKNLQPLVAASRVRLGGLEDGDHPGAEIDAGLVAREQEAREGLAGKMDLPVPADVVARYERSRRESERYAVSTPVVAKPPPAQEIAARANAERVAERMLQGGASFSIAADGSLKCSE